jgi:hypothetical protein
MNLLFFVSEDLKSFDIQTIHAIVRADSGVSKLARCPHLEGPERTPQDVGALGYFSLRI